MDQRFAMRRERDISDAVQRHAKHAFNVINSTLPRYIYMQTRVYWTKNKASGIEAFDIPEYSLEETLQNRCINDILYRHGQNVAKSTDRPKGVSPDADPIAVSIYSETILVNDWEPQLDGRRKARGMPILMVAGRTENGRQHIKLLPIAILNDETERRIMVSPKEQEEQGMEPPSPQMILRIEAMKETADDFLAPFFEGYNNGGSPREAFMNAS